MPRMPRALCQTLTATKLTPIRARAHMRVGREEGCQWRAAAARRRRPPAPLPPRSLPLRDPRWPLAICHTAGHELHRPGGQRRSWVGDATPGYSSPGRANAHSTLPKHSHVLSVLVIIPALVCPARVEGPAAENPQCTQARRHDGRSASGKCTVGWGRQGWAPTPLLRCAAIAARRPPLSVSKLSLHT